METTKVLISSFPRDLKDKVEELADKERRSFSAQAIKMIENDYQSQYLEKLTKARMELKNADGTSN